MASSENPLPLNASIAKLPVGFEGTPQEIADAISERLQISTQQVFALFTTGSSEPVTDTGPWAKDGNSWYYFDSNTGDYQPFTIPQGRLGYQISIEEPTDDDINLWFQIDDTGQPIAIKFRVVTGAVTTWVSPYYLKSEQFTEAEATAALLYQIRYPARASVSANQTVQCNNVAVKLNMNTIAFDTGSAYSAAASQFTAPVHGIYQAKIVTQWENDTGDAPSMQIGVLVATAGGANKGGNTVNIASPPGSRWNNAFSVDFELLEAEVIELRGLITDAVGTGQIALAAGGNSFWSISLVEAIAS